MSGYYPIFMDINNKQVLVVGGGSVAFRKAAVLLEYGAVVKIISPGLCEEMLKLVDGKRCLWIKKEYSADDLSQVELVFSCTEREKVNAGVAEDARARKIPVNVADSPDSCTFFVPSVLRRGDLSIAVSTAGNSPLVARQIRLQLEAVFGDEMRDYLDLLGSWRRRVKSLTEENRSLFWEKVTDGEVLTHIRDGKAEQAKEVIENCFQSLLA